MILHVHVPAPEARYVKEELYAIAVYRALVEIFPEEAVGYVYIMPRGTVEWYAKSRLWVDMPLPFVGIHPPDLPYDFQIVIPDQKELQRKKEL